MSRHQNAHNLSEKRRHPRINTVNVITYILFDDDRKKIGHGKGRTLELSQNGALLETNKPLHGSFVLLKTLNMDGEAITIKARIANRRGSEIQGLHLTGVEFTGPEDEQRNAIIALVKTYNYWKYAAYKIQRHASVSLS
ncbi:MAG: PilZ domain-containing protein [Desulfosalsimonadaceae bacterium]